jgi:hypothetical protein
MIGTKGLQRMSCSHWTFLFIRDTGCIFMTLGVYSRRSVYIHDAEC